MRGTALLLIPAALLLIMLLGGLIALFVAVGRRGGQQRRNEIGPLAAPGMAANRAAASRLLLQLTDDRQHHLTELEFAKLQLPQEIVADYARAIEEASAAADELSHAVSRTRDSDGGGPSGTREAGVLAAAMRRAEEAAGRLDHQAHRITQQRRELPPNSPSGEPR